MEIKSIINTLKKREKVTGTDGFTSELYQIIEEEIIQVTNNTNETDGQHGKSFYEALFNTKAK
jgi:hypothetical protein